MNKEKIIEALNNIIEMVEESEDQVQEEKIYVPEFIKIYSFLRYVDDDSIPILDGIAFPNNENKLLSYHDNDWYVDSPCIDHTPNDYKWYLKQIDIKDVEVGKFYFVSDIQIYSSIDKRLISIENYVLYTGIDKIPDGVNDSVYIYNGIIFYDDISDYQYVYELVGE